MSQSDDLLTSTQAGQILGKSGRTVLRLAESGQLAIAVTVPGPNGPKLFRRADVERLAEQRKAAS